MKNTLKIILFLSLSAILESCSSSDDIVDNNPDPTPTTFIVPATENIVMYEINPSAFSPNQNIQGIINRLDNIKDLGINTIWIMPIYPVGEVNSFGSPYCVKNFTSVRTSLGTMDNFKLLVDKAHEKGIAVILDWVANHTAWDNPWIYDHPEWYTQNSSGQIVSPAGTNWNDVADLNFNNAEMRLAMIAAMKFWVEETDIDGFRCDAADYVPYDFWLQANTALNAIPNKDLILLAEGARSDHFAAGFQINFAWDFMGNIKNVFNFNQSNVNTLFTTNTNEYNVVPSGKKKLRFTTNHDESNQATPITVYNGKYGALAASVITIFMQGVPMLYCGQEVGVALSSNYAGTASINWSSNSDMLLAYQKMLAFYNASTTARTGTLTNLSSADVAAFQKSGNEAVLVVVNVRSTSKTYTVPTTQQGIWTNALTNETITLSNNISLSPYQYLILKR
ncbi:alpha-amylase [Flavobacterium sp. J49]|uniref:alpha-amylase family glycosyl hydrolase n=1 Tax=Flavobacterium sp. J49 TaxID=2718534 RepID=UPI001592DD6E|nr:alpha-amylase family glycosyl hydrolase [Flavobacterium sp. J49]MBF6640438.1 alpha-amylase [Flavobacterium sp. J49]NIC01685.1 alpha-amylase [Flavobacterium sp. J49]